MFTTIFLAAALPWAEYGLVGLCMAALFGMLWRIIKLVGKRDDNLIDRQYVEEARKELLVEIEKREIRLGDLQEKTLKGLYKNMAVTEKLVMRLEDIEAHLDGIGE